MARTYEPFGRPDGWTMRMWREAMGDAGRHPASVDLVTRVTVGRMTFTLRGDKIPSAAGSAIREMTRNAKPRKMTTPKFFVGALAERDKLTFNQWQTREYHRALETGEWAA